MKTKTKIHVHDILKVIDINATLVERKTLDFLRENYVAYLDRAENMAEDIIDIVVANEPDAHIKSRSPIVRKQISVMAKLAEKYDAAYVRFTVI